MIRSNWKMMAARVALGALLLAGGTGCGAFNLKAAWAISETTPMQAVVRRADVARATANNVDRLMGATTVDDDSKWVAKLALKKADVEPMLKDIANDPEYTPAPGKAAKLRIVQAEAWALSLSQLCSKEKKSPSLFATVSPDVHSQYAEVSGQAKAVAKIKSDIANEEAAMDDKERAAEKADHEKKKAELQAQLEKTENEFKPKVESFLKKLSEDGAKASPEAKKQMAAAVAGLRRAVEDAKMANAAALIGYPKAMPGLKDEVKTIVKRIAADSIEEKIGTRPNLDKLAPEVKLTGGVSVTVAGLDPSDIGRLKPDDLVKDIAERSKNYVVHVVTLLGYIKETADILTIQSDVLDAAQKAISGDDKAGGGEDLGDLKVELEEAAAAMKANGPSGKGKGKRIPVKMTACEDAKKPAEPEPPAKVDAEPPKADDTMVKGKGKGKDKPQPKPKKGK